MECRASLRLEERRVSVHFQRETPPCRWHLCHHASHADDLPAIAEVSTRVVVSKSAEPNQMIPIAVPPESCVHLDSNQMSVGAPETPSGCRITMRASRTPGKIHVSHTVTSALVN